MYSSSILFYILFFRAVYVSRFCVSIPEVCENIRKITEIEEKPAKQPMKRQLSSHTKDSLYKAMKKTSSESLQRIHRLFRDQGAIAVTIWSDWLAKMVSRLVADTLRSRDEHFVFSTTNWEEVAIEEEGEQGQEVKSSIHVPAQVNTRFPSVCSTMVCLLCLPCSFNSFANSMFIMKNSDVDLISKMKCE